MKDNPHGEKWAYVCSQEMLLDAVEDWAQGFVMIREIEIEQGDRIDALLIPGSHEARIMQTSRHHKGDSKRYTYTPFFKRCGFVGVEAKMNSRDFQVGLKGNQFSRYAKNLSGLYIATPEDTIKTKAIPHDYGHLIIKGRFVDHRRRVSCFCARHPDFRLQNTDPEMLWRVFFRAYQEMKGRETEAMMKMRQAKDTIGHIAGTKIMKYLDGILKSQEGEAYDMARDSG